MRHGSRWMERWFTTWCAALTAVVAATAAAQDAPPATADPPGQAALVEDTAPQPAVGAAIPFLFEADWTVDQWWEAIAPLQVRGTPPDEPEQFETFLAGERERLRGLADAAEAFVRRFPADDRSAEAVAAMIQARVGLEALASDPSQTGRVRDSLASLDTLEDASDAMRSAVSEGRFQLDIMELMRSVGGSERLDRIEERSRAFLRGIPDSRAAWQALLYVAVTAENVDLERAAGLYRDMAENAPTQVMRDRAQGALRRLAVVGTPFEMPVFEALDGSVVDVGAMRGEVALVLFWASWSSPSIREFERVERVHGLHKDAGLRVIGISLDSDRGRLFSFLGSRPASWPQHFDGRGWDNQFARYYGISSVPSVWLIDRAGIVRYVNARAGLERKVEELIAEPAPAEPADVGDPSD